MELFVEEGVLTGQVFHLEQPVVAFGRGGQTTEERIALPEQGVSRQHMRLQRGPQGWMLVDLGSTNGTYLNGQRIREQEAHLLRTGDKVTLGGMVLVVRESEEPEVGVEQKEVPEQRPHPALLIAGALLLVVALVGIVILLVAVLRPKQSTETATPMPQMEQIMTALPVPTELQDMATAVLPLMTELPLPLFGPKETATPEAALPGGQGLVTSRSLARQMGAAPRGEFGPLAITPEP
jgi:pSer/pThr/pTyr-binding forkhead associated (FHA) protein